MDKENEKGVNALITNDISFQDLYIQYLIDGLKNKSIYFYDVPKKYSCNFDIVKNERQLGIRKIGRKGYDILFNNFFVEEIVLYKNYLGEIKEKELITLFNEFSEYYEFLQGDIYENACYYKYTFSNNEITRFLIDIDKINFVSLINYDIDEFSENEIQELKYNRNLKFEIRKFYSKTKNCFIVEQQLKDEYGRVIRNYNNTFKYFFDFVYFLKNDLSNADLSEIDLLFYDILQNTKRLSDINFTNAKIQSTFINNLNIARELINCSTTTSYNAIQNNENSTLSALCAKREVLSFTDAINFQTVYYITDLHLLHRLYNAKCKNLNDINNTIKKIIQNLLNDICKCDWEETPALIGGYSYTVLIGGDTSSDFLLFKLFLNALRRAIDKSKLDVQVIFTLGNHELWDFGNVQINETIEAYKKIINDNGMYLLQNNIVFKYDESKFEEINTDELKNISKGELTNRLRTARLIFFGGIGFAGYNEEFNANQLIYRYAINRQQEIAESKKFEELYTKVCEYLSDRRVIVFTHMPQRDWCSHSEPHKGFVYVSGHNHRNYFYDDGDYRIYSDNQIGYKQVSCRLKCFYLDDDYDFFFDYEDGIYELTREEYYNFYRGKNILMDFNRDFYKLYMLKKNGYYMFVLQSANGNLNILNGGAVKGLVQKDVNYYFENMDKVISYIKTPLDDFSNHQKQIADEIKAIGGSGNIHGAIIDIDFFNHLYVNPVDLTVTAYWASDIINKVVFDDTPSLLQSNCPDIYANYLKQIENKSEAALTLNRSSIVRPPQLYLDTDIYRASREIKKMQRLSSNILSIWVEQETKKLSENKE